ncbi:hypothetical protein [Cyprinid herpesvirus 3]|uniref:Uncharacterized protein n=2 Tax=Cyprinid herpesvirus 3 TaxID=180230 RepID=A3QMM4_CYHV3|nr:hypothetical protein [Cyprinid herpesvirus 3]
MSLAAIRRCGRTQSRGNMNLRGHPSSHTTPLAQRDRKFANIMSTNANANENDGEVANPVPNPVPVPDDGKRTEEEDDHENLVIDTSPVPTRLGRGRRRRKPISYKEIEEQIEISNKHVSEHIFNKKTQRHHPYTRSNSRSATAAAVSAAVSALADEEDEIDVETVDEPENLSVSGSGGTTSTSKHEGSRAMLRAWTLSRCMSVSSASDTVVNNRMLPPVWTIAAQRPAPLSFAKRNPIVNVMVDTPPVNFETGVFRRAAPEAAKPQPPKLLAVLPPHTTAHTITICPMSPQRYTVTETPLITSTASSSGTTTTTSSASGVVERGEKVRAENERMEVDADDEADEDDGEVISVMSKSIAAEQQQQQPKKLTITIEGGKTLVLPPPPYPHPHLSHPHIYVPKAQYPPQKTQTPQTRVRPPGCQQHLKVPALKAAAETAPKPNPTHRKCDQSEEHIALLNCATCAAGFRTRVLRSHFRELLSDCEFLQDVVCHYVWDDYHKTKGVMELMKMVQQNVVAVATVMSRPMTCRSYIYVRTVLESSDMMCQRMSRCLLDSCTVSAKACLLDIAMYANKYHASILHYMMSGTTLEQVVTNGSHSSWNVVDLRLHYPKNMLSFLNGASCSQLFLWREYMPEKLKLVTSILSVNPKLKAATGFARVINALPNLGTIRGLSVEQIKSIVPKCAVDYMPCEASMTGTLRKVKWRTPTYPIEDPQQAVLYQAIFAINTRLDQHVTIDEAYAVFKMYMKQPYQNFRHAVGTVLMRCFAENVPTRLFTQEDQTSLMYSEMLASTVGCDALAFVPLNREEWRLLCGLGLSRDAVQTMMHRQTWPSDLNWSEWFTVGGGVEMFKNSALTEPVARIVASAIAVTKGKEASAKPTLEDWLTKYGHTGSIPVELLST